MEAKTKFPVYMTKEEADRLEANYQRDGCASKTEFIMKAVNFYIDYLNTQDAGTLLPRAVSSAMEGRLGQLEKRMSAALYREAVQMEMVMRFLADCYRVDEEYLWQLRSKSVKSVKATNGQLQFEDVVREKWDESWPD